MKQKGFATIFGLCLILVVALIVKGVQEAETNHAREVLNFEMEQALQSAAESGILEAVKYVRDHPDYLPVADGWVKSKLPIPPPPSSLKKKTLKKEDKTFDIKVEAWGERGKIHFKYSNGNKIKNPQDGVYIMSRATIKGGVLGEDIYRRAYAYILDGDTRIYFMELPTQ